MSSRDGGPADPFGDIRWVQDRAGFGDLLHLAALKGLDSICFHLLALLRLHESERLTFGWPSRRRLAKLAGLHVDTVDRHLRHLRGLTGAGEEDPDRPQLVLVEVRKPEGRSNRYKTLAPPEVVERAKDRFYSREIDPVESTDQNDPSRKKSGREVPEEIREGSPKKSGRGIPEEITDDREVSDGEVGSRGKNREVELTPPGFLPGGVSSAGSAPDGPVPRAQSPEEDAGPDSQRGARRRRGDEGAADA